MNLIYRIFLDTSKGRRECPCGCLITSVIVRMPYTVRTATLRLRRVRQRQGIIIERDYKRRLIASFCLQALFTSPSANTSDFGLLRELLEICYRIADTVMQTCELEAQDTLRLSARERRGDILALCSAILSLRRCGRINIIGSID